MYFVTQRGRQMNEQAKTNPELIEELSVLKQRIHKLEHSASDRNQAKVVDDNATNREVLMAQLAAWGVRSEETPDAPTALQVLYLAKDAGDPFVLAILDMQMPGMKGRPWPGRSRLMKN